MSPQQLPCQHSWLSCAILALSMTAVPTSNELAPHTYNGTLLITTTIAIVTSLFITTIVITLIICYYYDYPEAPSRLPRALNPKVSQPSATWTQASAAVPASWRLPQFSDKFSDTAMPATQFRWDFSTIFRNSNHGIQPYTANVGKWHQRQLVHITNSLNSLKGVIWGIR